MGLVVPWFLGFPSQDLIEGARKSLAQSELFTLVDRFCEEALESFKRKEWISFFWGYHSSFKTMGAWIQQLWAESLAKEKTLLGHQAPQVSTPMVALGSVDQHSLLQQVLEGAKDKWVILLGRENQLPQVVQTTSGWVGLPYLEEFDFNRVLPVLKQATRQALEDQKVSFIELISGPISLESLGAQFLFWELVIATLALELEIDAYDQPGVELAKRHIPGLFR
jgi:glucose-6-phosphate isomerase